MRNLLQFAVLYLLLSCQNNTEIQYEAAKGNRVEITGEGISIVLPDSFDLLDYTIAADYLEDNHESGLSARELAGLSGLADAYIYGDTSNQYVVFEFFPMEQYARIPSKFGEKQFKKIVEKGSNEGYSVELVNAKTFVSGEYKIGKIMVKKHWEEDDYIEYYSQYLINHSNKSRSTILIIESETDIDYEPYIRSFRYE